MPLPKFNSFKDQFRITFHKTSHLSMNEHLKIGLSERQIKAISYIQQDGSITNSQYQELNNVLKEPQLESLLS